MTSLQVDLRGNKAIPPCKGPQLLPFKYRAEPVEFIQLLSNTATASAEDVFSHVFKARFGKKGVYAVKIFKFSNVRELRATHWRLHNREVDDAELFFHVDAFFAECRAYGKIQEIEKVIRRKNARSSRSNSRHQTRQGRPKAGAHDSSSKQGQTAKTHELAVPCFGYMGISAESEQILLDKFGIDNWRRPPSDMKLHPGNRPPLRALVKRLVENKPALGKPKIMLSDLKVLRLHGLYQLDIATRNYMDGLLIDFNLAWTKPHWCLNRVPEHNLKHVLVRDLYDFDRMIMKEIPKTNVRAAPNNVRKMSLRKYTLPRDVTKFTR